MADWTDGPEYAPVERPHGFATPRTAPLAVAEPEPHPSQDLPSRLPEHFEAPREVHDLATLVPRPQAPRDPSVAFEQAGRVETGWAAAHSWHPTMPLGDAASPTPQQSPVLPPGASFPPPAGTPVVTGQPASPDAAPPAVPALPLDQYPPPTGPAAALPPPPGAAPAVPAGPVVPSGTPFPAPLAPPAATGPTSAEQFPPPRPHLMDPAVPPPQRASGPNLGQALNGVAGVSVGVLALGAAGVVPYLMLFIASLMANRLQLGRAPIRRAYSTSFFVLVGSLVYDRFSGQPQAHLDLLGQLCCLAVAVVTVLATWRDVPGRRR